MNKNKNKQTFATNQVIYVAVSLICWHGDSASHGNIWPMAHVFAHCSTAGVCLLILTTCVRKNSIVYACACNWTESRKASLSSWDPPFCFLKRNGCTRGACNVTIYLFDDCVEKYHYAMLIVCFYCYVKLYAQTQTNVNWKWYRRQFSWNDIQLTGTQEIYVNYDLRSTKSIPKKQLDFSFTLFHILRAVFLRMFIC